MSDSPISEFESGFVCDGATSMHSVCGGEASYKHEGKQYCVLHLPSKDKSADFEKALQKKLNNRDFDFSGVWFPNEVSFVKFDFRERANFSNATFSADVSFNSAKFSAKADFSHAKFSAKADFNSAKFGERADFGFAIFSALADFTHATFGAVADFIYAAFNAADFTIVNFSAPVWFVGVTFGADSSFNNATFSADSSFNTATFSATSSFMSAKFNGKADFSAAKFSATAYFSFATFSAATDFSCATFSATSFRSAAFADHVRFAGNEKSPVFTDTSSLDLQFLRIEKPDHVSFHTISLRPHWFVNVDARKFDFTNVDWDWRSIHEEVESLGSVSPAHRMLSIACWHLAENAEGNRRYEEASRFRYMAMDARRLEEGQGLAVWKLSWWYWLASGYGERMLRALVMLLGILFLFAMLYHQVGFARWEPRVASESDAVAAQRDGVGAPLEFRRALAYSAGVLMLQKPEPRPATAVAQGLVILETILGPVQAALLALAIRRKFMR